MTDERLAMHAAEDDPPMVEEVWEDVLVEFGIERDRAEQITRLVFSNPELTMTVREPDEISRIVDEELASLDLDPESGEGNRKLRTLLVDILQSGLDGVLLGPAVAPNDVAHDVANSRGVAFDAIRRSFRETNVPPELIDFTEFPSTKEDLRASEDTAAPAAPSGPSGPGKRSERERGGFSMNRAFPQDIRDSDQPSEPTERSEAQEILSFIDEARTDRSPIVRKQVMESLAELAKVPEIRSDRQIDKLVQAYHEEPDPEVRAAIVSGLETYVRDTSGADPRNGGGPPSDDEAAESDIDPRDAATSMFPDEDE